MTSQKEQFYIQRIAELEKQVAELIKINAELTEQVAKLTDKVAKLSKNSSNSSKPPSSDIVKPPRKTKSKMPCKTGAQPGHTKHERPLFITEEIDDFQTHTLDACPDCGGILALVKNSSRVVQQVEIVEKPVKIEQHTGLCYWCEHCQKFHYAPLPSNIEKGQLAGPHLTAIVAYMKGACHCSFSTIRKFLRDVIGVTISRGQLSKLVQKAATALEQVYTELLEYLPYEAKLNVDETGHKEKRNRFWTWCFRADAYTLFKIADTRGSRVLIDAMREMFSIFHKAEELTANSFTKAMDESRKTFLDIALSNVPDSRQAQNLANRFREHGEAYFRFITTPGIEPTNNMAEQAIRFVVIDRHITQGTHSEKGRAWCERIWTVLATCASQGRSAFDFIYQSIQAHFSDQPLPSLLGP